MALLDSEKSTRPPTSKEVAWFSKTVRDVTYVYFAEKGEANGDIDPVFVLAAFVLEAKPHKIGADNYYGINATYDVAPHWQVGFAGIRQLAQAQAAEDKTLLSPLGSAKLPAAGPSVHWTQVTLSASLGTVPVVASSKIADDIFVPERSRFATTDENWHLIGNPIWGTHTLPRLYMMTAVVLESARSASVVSLVVNRQGVIVACGIKGPNDGGCSHAEVKALFSLKGRLPDKGAIFGTLKPCAMCAGLLHATDPGGSLRKYWVRDDTNKAADWSNIGGGFKLANGHQLDKGCKDVSYLKVGPSGDGFFEQFNAVRKASQDTTSAKRASKPEEDGWYKSWATGYSFPKAGRWAALQFRIDGDLKGDAKVAKTQLLEKTVTGGMSLKSFLNQHLAIKEQSPKIKNGWSGLDALQMKEVTDAFETYRKAKFDTAYPAQVIKIIPWNPGSVALSNSARDAFKAKLVKYEDAEFRNPNVKAVLTYLTDFLGQMNVRL